MFPLWNTNQAKAYNKPAKYFGKLPTTEKKATTLWSFNGLDEILWYPE